MNERIKKLAEQSGLVLDGEHWFSAIQQADVRNIDLERFAELIRADERKQQALDKKADNARELRLDYEPEQKPVAWELRAGKTDRVLMEITNNRERAYNWECGLNEVVPLYYAPLKREWQGLTDQEKNNCLVEADPCETLATPEAQQLILEIEAKLREKNE